MSNPNVEKSVEDILSSTILFKGFDAEGFSAVAKASKENDFAINDLIYEHSPGEPTPLIVILSGFVAVLDAVSNVDGDKVFDALVMPLQVIGEFQLLGDSFPENIELIACHGTRTLEIDPTFLKELSSRNKLLFYRNLGRTLVEKINIGNRHLYLRGVTSVSRKLGEYLTEVCKHPVWRRVLRKSELGGVDIAITWTVMRLKQYLSCDERVLALALQRLVEMEGAKIVRFDEMNKSIQVNAPDLGNANKKNSTFNYHTLFEIRDIRQSGLRKLKSLRELSKQSS